MSYTPPLLAEVTAFATTASLAAAATYDSSVDWDGDVNGYTQVQTEITSDMDGTLVISFCSDSLFANEVRGLSIPYTGGSGYQFFAAPAFANFIKYSFTNNGVGANTIYLTTKLTTTAVQPQLLTTNAFIAEAMVATLGRNLLVGQNDGGQFKNVKIDNQQHLEVNASNPKTAYDELPVAQYSPVVQISFPYNINSDIVNKVEVAGGTVIQDFNMAVLNTSATTASSATVTSIGQIPFRPGQGHVGRLSCLFDGTPTSTGYMGIGLGDADNGFGFLLDSTAFNIAYRTDGVPQTPIPQTSWNIDKMDGSGPSGMILDITKGNAYQISYGDGFGCVNFSIESQETGDYVLVHILHLANTKILPSTYNSTFPLRAEASNGGGTADLTLSVASMSGFIEGENVNDARYKVINSKGFTSAISGSATEQLLATWRNDSDVFTGTGNNKVYCPIKALSFNSDGASTGTIRIYENMTIATPSFLPINASTSVVSTDIAGTITPGTGKLVFESYAEKDGKGGKYIDLSNLGLVMVPGYTYTAVGHSGNGDMSIALYWVEDF
jgi:hypothetical protein